MVVGVDVLISFLQIAIAAVGIAAVGRGLWLISPRGRLRWVRRHAEVDATTIDGETHSQSAAGYQMVCVGIALLLMAALSPIALVPLAASFVIGYWNVRRYGVATRSTRTWGFMVAAILLAALLTVVAARH